MSHEPDAIVKIVRRDVRIEAAYNEQLGPVRSQDHDGWDEGKVRAKWKHNTTTQERVLAIPLEYTKVEAMDTFWPNHPWVECTHCGRDVGVAVFFDCDLTLCPPCLRAVMAYLEASL